MPVVAEEEVTGGVWKVIFFDLRRAIYRNGGEVGKSEIRERSTYGTFGIPHRTITSASRSLE